MSTFEISLNNLNNDNNIITVYTYSDNDPCLKNFYTSTGVYPIITGQKSVTIPAYYYKNLTSNTTVYCYGYDIYGNEYIWQPYNYNITSGLTTQWLSNSLSQSPTSNVIPLIAINSLAPCTDNCTCSSGRVCKRGYCVIGNPSLLSSCNSNSDCPDSFGCSDSCCVPNVFPIIAGTCTPVTTGNGDDTGNGQITYTPPITLSQLWTILIILIIIIVIFIVSIIVIRKRNVKKSV